MRDELFSFQKQAVSTLLEKVKMASAYYPVGHQPQIISFTAPTGAGKTIMAATAVESIFFGTESFTAQPDSIFVWLSDSPQLNEQSRMKFRLKADKIRAYQLITVSEASFDREAFEEGHIYFLNTQKLGRGSKLTQAGDNRSWTIWQTIQNTAAQKGSKLIVIIDEAHRGMRDNRDAARATTIMQKFIKGSQADGLQPLPVVIGMSATTERFNRLVEGITTSVKHDVVVPVADVRQSGLLKDRIIVRYPDQQTADGMHVLHAAAEEWKKKCEAWYQYCAARHLPQVNPILVIQALNSTGSEVTATDLDACLTVIENRTGYTLHQGEVVHTFGQCGDLTVHGLTIPAMDASAIDDNGQIRVVFFKENLSTGWDCPRAETMMSFRRAIDATYIAQLLGRMVRTPLQRRIETDESLNDVFLYLPFFDAGTVEDVIKAFKDEEGGEIPADITGESIEAPIHTIWTSRPRVVPVAGQTSIWDSQPQNTDIPGSNTPGLPYVPVVTTTKPHIPADQTSASESQVSAIPSGGHQTSTVQSDSTPEQEIIPHPHEEAIQISLPLGQIDRPAIIEAINHYALLNYHVARQQTVSYLTSLVKLTNLLAITNIDSHAYASFQTEVTNRIHSFVENMKTAGTYSAGFHAIATMQFAQQVFDPFGEAIHVSNTQTVFTAPEAVIEHQRKSADQKLGDTSITLTYLTRFGNIDNPSPAYIDCILFVNDSEAMTNLHEWAKGEFNRLSDTHRADFAIMTDSFRFMYEQIMIESDVISPGIFHLVSDISAVINKDGEEYDNHLYVDPDSGKAIIKLNSWEAGVLKEEMKRPDFVCWLRNVPRAKWALCLPYDYDGEKRGFYPDMLIIRRHPSGNYVVDVMEPHMPAFDDNLPKAKAFAQYGKDEAKVVRLQLIHEVTDATGTKRFRRLDLAKSGVRDKVLAATTADELKAIFAAYGVIE